MVSRITPEFCWSEAERLVRLAVVSIDRSSRDQLLEIAVHYRQMAAQLHKAQAEVANSNESEGEGKDTETDRRSSLGDTPNIVLRQ